MNMQSGPDLPLDRTIDAWLDLGPTELSDRVVERARAEVHRTHQRTKWSGTWRWTVARPGRLGVSLAIATVVLVLIGTGLRLATTPPVGVPGSPSPAVSPIELASPAASAPAQATVGIWTATRDMVVARYEQTATLLSDGRVLVVGGLGESGQTLSSAELYDPATGTWTPTDSMGTPRVGASATVLPDGKVLIAGGNEAGSGETDLNSAELYDPATGSWVATGRMAESRAGHAAILLQSGKVLVAGGSSGGDGEIGRPSRAVTFSELYDPKTGTWATTGSMGKPGGGPALMRADGRVLVVGIAAMGGAEQQLYDPSTGTWTSAGAEFAVGSTNTVLTDGRILITHSGSDHDAQLYDPATGTLTAGGTQVTSTATAAVRLLDGRVLVTGALDLSGGGPAQLVGVAEVYDPLDGSWTATGNVVETRAYGQTITLLSDGRVLVAGGVASGSSGDTAMSSAELYDPTAIH